LKGNVVRKLSKKGKKNGMMEEWSDGLVEEWNLDKWIDGMME